MVDLLVYCLLNRLKVFLFLIVVLFTSVNIIISTRIIDSDDFKYFYEMETVDSGYRLPPFIEVVSSYSSTSTDLIIDTISMGNRKSAQNRLMLKSQKETWLSQIPGARWFFGATENLCFPECLYQNVSSQEREEVCNKKQYATIPEQGDRPTFWASKTSHLDSDFKKETGWWCAQKRVARALQIMIDLYKAHQTSSSASLFPDWLLIVDDDTWFNPHYLPLVLKKTKCHLCFADRPMALAPSLLHNFAETDQPIHYGGAGLAINKEMLHAISQPTYCHEQKAPAVVCERLEQAGYLSKIQDGDSLLDFIVALLGRRVSCLHSDWWQSLLVWLAGQKMERMKCDGCYANDMKLKNYAILHKKGNCAANMLSCHRMNHIRQTQMTKLAMTCSRKNFQKRKCTKLMDEGVVLKAMRTIKEKISEALRYHL